MKGIKNIQNLSVSELFSELYDLDEESYIAYTDLYNHFRANTNNFDPKQVSLLMNDIAEFISGIKVIWDGDIVTLQELSFNKELIDKYELDGAYGLGLFELYEYLHECIHEFDSSNEPEDFDEQIPYLKYGTHYIERYAQMVDNKAQDLEIMWEGVQLDIDTGKYYYRGKEISFQKDEIETILPHLKRPQNTHKQQFSILEHTGVIDYLKGKYIGITDVKLAVLIANILNKNAQNTRQMLMFTGSINQESNDQKNKDLLEQLFIEIGLSK